MSSQMSNTKVTPSVDCKLYIEDFIGLTKEDRGLFLDGSSTCLECGLRPARHPHKPSQPPQGTSPSFVSI